MVNGDLSHSTWLVPQLDELSHLRELCSISSFSHYARQRSHPCHNPTELSGVGGSVIRCHIALLTLNKKEDVRGKEDKRFLFHSFPLFFLLFFVELDVTFENNETNTKSSSKQMPFMYSSTIYQIIVIVIFICTILHL